MQALDLYGTIEEYLDFEKQVKTLHNKIKEIVLEKNISTHIDIGCGQGAFCQEISKQNIKTLGVDLSAKQIELAKLKGVDARCIDIKDITEKYECATAIFDVINYLDDEYVEEFLTHTYNLLEKDGYFVFDINSLFGFEEVAQGTLTIDNEDSFIAIDANFEDDILYTDMTMFNKEQNNLFSKVEGTIQQYYYDNDSLSTLLKKIGFNIEKIINFNLHNFDEDDKYIFICKKV